MNLSSSHLDCGPLRNFISDFISAMNGNCYAISKPPCLYDYLIRYVIALRPFSTTYAVEILLRSH